jgi:hypothetical protein
MVDVKFYLIPIFTLCTRDMAFRETQIVAYRDLYTLLQHRLDDI